MIDHWDRDSKTSWFLFTPFVATLGPLLFHKQYREAERNCRRRVPGTITHSLFLDRTWCRKTDCGTFGAHLYTVPALISHQNGVASKLFSLPFSEGQVIVRKELVGFQKAEKGRGSRFYD